MQKLLKRVATAERVVAKRRATRARQERAQDAAELRATFENQFDHYSRELRHAKQMVRDDWNLGPLAPAFRMKTYSAGDMYGAIHESRFQSHYAMKPYQLEARCAWAGGVKYFCLAKGDRVVLLEGPDKGKIGTLRTISKSAAEVVVEDLNKANIKLPIESRGSDPPTLLTELALPASAVRLVHPIRDPKTGETRDAIISQLEPRDIVKDELTREKRWSRVIPGLNMEIPWPPEKPKDFTLQAEDTKRIDVEAQTFVPTLLSPPIPENVIDELRNPYSRFRTRHTPEYIAKHEAMSKATKDRHQQQLMESMRTPLQEYHRAERERKKKKGKPRLTVEMLEAIGRVMAKNRNIPIDAATTATEAPVTPTNAVIPQLPAPPPRETLH